MCVLRTFVSVPMLVLFAFSPWLAHVPTYQSRGGKCLVPPHDPTTSQVLYIRAEPGTVSGLEYHCPNAAECQIDFEANQQIDWDATFKEPYDVSTVRLTVGCGGCGLDDAVIEDPIVVQYDAAKLEPFSTTRYYGLTGVSKKYNSSGLAPSQCANGHFGIRLETFANATTITWGAVVGLGATLPTCSVSLLPPSDSPVSSAQANDSPRRSSSRSVSI